MSNWLYTAETGLADGTTVTLANSDDGTAGFAWTPGILAAGTAKFSTASPLRDALSIEFSAPTAGDWARAEIDSLINSTNIVLDVAFRTPNYPGGGTRIIELLATGVFGVRIELLPAGNLRAYNAANTTVWTSTNTVNTGTDGWRIGIRCVAATSTTGRLEISYYNTKTGTTATESMTTITNGNFGVAAFNQLRVGKINSTPAMPTFWSDDWQISDTRTTLFNAPASSGGNLWVYTAETGLADGTAVTLANSDDGTAGFAWTPEKIGGGTVEFSTVSPLRGALSIKVTAATTNDVGRAVVTGLFSSNNVVLDIAFRTPTFPGGASTRIIELMAGAVSALRIGITTAGKIEAYDAANVNKWTSTTAINTASTGWRIGIRCVAATSTTGYLEISYYNTKTGTTATESMTTITNGDFGTAAIDTLRVGKINSSPTWAAVYSDDWQISDTRTTLFNAPAADGDTVGAGSDQVDIEPWSTVTLTASSSSGSATWSWVSGPNPTLLGSGALVRTFVAPASFSVTTSIFQAANGTATDTVSVTYLPATDGLVTSTGPVVVLPVRLMKKL